MSREELVGILTLLGWRRSASFHVFAYEVWAKRGRLDTIRLQILTTYTPDHATAIIRRASNQLPGGRL